MTTILNNQILDTFENLKDESIQYGSLKWMAYLRNNEFGVNKLAVPIGSRVPGTQIWMQIRQPVDKRHNTRYDLESPEVARRFPNTLKSRLFQTLKKKHRDQFSHMSDSKDVNSYADQSLYSFKSRPI